MREGDGTKFTIDRKIFSSDIWFASPWKLKIWIYLIGQANHTDGLFMGVKIKRGQLIRSYRTIQKDCSYMIGYRIKKPSLDTIRRVCDALTKELRIEQQTLQCGTLFTICNYNDLQPMTNEKINDEPNTKSYDNRTDIVHNNNDNNDNNNNYTSDFLEFYKVYPKHVGKMAAFKAWKKIKNKDEDFMNTVFLSIEMHKKTDQWKEKNGKYIPHPATWLNGRNWEDEIEVKKPFNEL